MNPLLRRLIQQSLRHKGFKQEGDIWYLWYKEKKTHIRIKLSSGQKYSEYRDGALKKKIQPLRLQNLKQVKDLFICPMSGEEYIELLLFKSIKL